MVMDGIKSKKLDLKGIFSGKILSYIYCSLFVLCLLMLTVYEARQYTGRLKEGDIALRSLYAPYDFSYPFGVNEKETEEKKNNVKLQVPAIFRIDQSIEDGSINKLNTVFNVLSQNKNITDQVLLNEISQKITNDTELTLSLDAVSFLLAREDLDSIRVGIVDIFVHVFSMGVMSESEKVNILNEYRSIQIDNGQKKLLGTVNAKDILTDKTAYEVCKKYSLTVFSDNSQTRKIAMDIVKQMIKPNLVFNEADTEKAKNLAIKNAPVIYNMVSVKKNELILERGKRITAAVVAQLVQLGVTGGKMQKITYLFGMLFSILILLGLAIAYFFISDKKTISKPKYVAILLINSFFIIIAAQVIINSPQSSYLIPLAGFSMLIALLINANAAIFTTFFLSIYIGLLAGGKVEVTLVLIVGSLISVYMVMGARRRSKIIIAGLAGGIGSAVAIVAIGLLNNLESRIFLYDCSWGMISGIVSIFLVMGALPIVEYLFKCTTNITLLELSDLNHPLLKELTLKAPGTYQHSIMVGNLAEAACDAIGANSLLSRVGAYYHDIGKIEKAEYFSENEMGVKSKHEKLTASMSALIISNHVKDGVELATKYKFNPKIINFIKEHHGTSLIYFFYRKALEKAHDQAALNEQDFRYDGPKPQTKESAIVLLADSVEASSRALSDPTPARIKGLVQKIINNKFIDHQLDECELTLKDLDKIASSFVRVLTAVFHTRLEYPQATKNTSKEDDKDKCSKS
ncbi:MAG: HDIG domain-containing protein [Candidatus Omnitrophica bacterium]|nr:HDIG domain-containing protein [Candidatus Omnitrophota bacterium]